MFKSVRTLFFSAFLSAVIKSDPGEDSSSPSTTPHTHSAPAFPGPPTLALAQPQPPRVPPTPTSHAPHLGPPYPLSTPDVLAQGMTSVPPSAPMHPGLHPAGMLQSSPALIKVRRPRHLSPFSADVFRFLRWISNSKGKARRGKQTPPLRRPTISSANRLRSLPRLSRNERPLAPPSSPKERPCSQIPSISWEAVWNPEGLFHRSAKSS